MLLDGHFVLEQTTRSRGGYIFNFNGTGGVWRKKAIEAAGGWHDDTICEDTDLSYRAHLAGYRGVFLRDVPCPSELPVQIAALEEPAAPLGQGAHRVLPEAHAAAVAKPAPAAQEARRLVPPRRQPRVPGLALHDRGHAARDAAAHAGPRRGAGRDGRRHGRVPPRHRHAAPLLRGRDAGGPRQLVEAPPLPALLPARRRRPRAQQRPRRPRGAPRPPDRVRPHAEAGRPRAATRRRPGRARRPTSA